MNAPPGALLFAPRTSLPVGALRCLGQTCGAERSGCARFQDGEDDPLHARWAGSLRRANLPASEPCPERITAASLAAPSKEVAA
jgi:hypothetical protein